jgi:deoxyribose-phosphate aldolase
VAAVAGGFPAGQLPLGLKVAEVAWVVAAGAAEVDAVIARGPALADDWAALYHEVRAMKAAAGAATLKVILATGELGDLERVARASRTCLLAGADFLKTSTGKEAVNATLPAGAVMLRALRDHAARHGHMAGFKAAGGIRGADEVLTWQALVAGLLGAEALAPARFRIGASGALANITRTLSSELA